jgi:hypothetical protein
MSSFIMWIIRSSVGPTSGYPFILSHALRHNYVIESLMTQIIHRWTSFLFHSSFIIFWVSAISLISASSCGVRLHCFHLSPCLQKKHKIQFVNMIKWRFLVCPALDPPQSEISPDLLDPLDLNLWSDEPLRKVDDNKVTQSIFRFRTSTSISWQFFFSILQLTKSLANSSILSKAVVPRPVGSVLGTVSRLSSYFSISISCSYSERLSRDSRNCAVQSPVMPFRSMCDTWTSWNRCALLSEILT